ncbi:unnamed protein product [Lactuca virosa]|uniref:Uncharacterized protein n=1 Tax=Lactuca virosa TaxID=75947 RepID=A0AAU9MSG8_9ASTR|nr:unnamed protein product [Lactuca virosa]
MEAEEHVTPSKSNLGFSFEGFDDVSDDDDHDVNDNDDDDDDEDVRMFEPSKELVNEAVISLAETEKEINIFKQPNDPTPEQMEALIEKLQSTARKRPQIVLVTTEFPSGSDKDDSNASLMPRKRRRRDPRPGVLITEPVQQPTSNVEPTQVNQDDRSPIFDEDFLANEETFASGSSSAPPPPEHDSASFKLAKLHAFQRLYSSVKRKGNIYWLRARR